MLRCRPASRSARARGGTSPSARSARRRRSGPSSRRRGRARRGGARRGRGRGPARGGCAPRGRPRSPPGRPGRGRRRRPSRKVKPTGPTFAPSTAWWRQRRRTSAAASAWPVAARRAGKLVRTSRREWEAGECEVESVPPDDERPGPVEDADPRMRQEEAARHPGTLVVPGDPEEVQPDVGELGEAREDPLREPGGNPAPVEEVAAVDDDVRPRRSPPARGPARSSRRSRPRGGAVRPGAATAGRGRDGCRRGRGPGPASRPRLHAGSAAGWHRDGVRRTAHQGEP